MSKEDPPEWLLQMAQVLGSLQGLVSQQDRRLLKVEQILEQHIREFGAFRGEMERRMSGLESQIASIKNPSISLKTLAKIAAALGSSFALLATVVQQILKLLGL